MPFVTILAASLASVPVAPADAADLSCIALFATMAGEDTQQQAGMTGAIMFYIGRIEGRGSGLDLQANLNRAVEDLAASRDRIKAEAQRCGGEMVAKGEEVQRIGNGISANSPQRPGRK